MNLQNRKSKYYHFNYLTTLLSKLTIPTTQSSENCRREKCDSKLSLRAHRDI